MNCLQWMYPLPNVALPCRLYYCMISSGMPLSLILANSGNFKVSQKEVGKVNAHALSFQGRNDTVEGIFDE